MSQPEISALAGVNARFEARTWDFSVHNRPEIERRWQEKIAANPHLFNGTVLMQHRWEIREGTYHTAYSPVDYASFLLWRDMGFPGEARRNGFAMAALRAADGPFLLGVMGPHTANAGKAYFPGGTPDMGDVTADQRVDLEGSMVRELLEETGLLPHEVAIEGHWTLVVQDIRAAFLKPARLVYAADEAKALIEQRLPTLPEPELSGMRIIRSERDIDERIIPAWAAAYMRRAFSISEE